MARAIFNSLRGEKSALIMVKANVLEFSASPVYVPRTGANLLAGRELTDDDKGHEFDIPDGFKLVDIVDIDTGEVRTTKDGVPLKQLSYS
jgi:hypothetical protein